MDVRQKVEQLPHLPGVYRYFNDEGTIIYVGKAKDLRKRVAQYFRPADQLDRKTNALVANIADLQFTVVETEEDALLLENNLIKQLQPRYNILLKDDKTYPWICIRKERFPRVTLTRRYERDGSSYFGPYASAIHARRMLDLISSIFRLRICNHQLTRENIDNGRIRPCLNYHLGKCNAPCAGLHSEDDYIRQIDEIKSILSGRVRIVISEFRDRMIEASSQLKFEEALLWKEKIDLLEAHHKRQQTVGHGILDIETYRLLQEKKLPRSVMNAEKALAQLQKDLDMKVTPHHIECFDNSNIQGTDPVAACVVFKEGVPSKKDYRHFNIKTVVGANDYASMKEVVNRRYSRLLAEGEELPQLVVIDGGRGQLNCALEALNELGIQDKIFAVGIAERLEVIIVPGDPNPLFLDKNSASLKILMQIRDEAHRFGITHHRDKRSKGQIKSELSSIPGVGPTTEAKLLKNFKSVARLKMASYDEIAAVTGPKMAKTLTDYFTMQRLAEL